MKKIIFIMICLSSLNVTLLAEDRYAGTTVEPAPKSHPKEYLPATKEEIANQQEQNAAKKTQEQENIPPEPLETGKGQVPRQAPSTVHYQSQLPAKTPAESQQTSSDEKPTGEETDTTATQPPTFDEGQQPPQLVSKKPAPADDKTPQEQAKIHKSRADTAVIGSNFLMEKGNWDQGIKMANKAIVLYKEAKDAYSAAKDKMGFWDWITGKKGKITKEIKTIENAIKPIETFLDSTAGQILQGKETLKQAEVLQSNLEKAKLQKIADPDTQAALALDIHETYQDAISLLGDNPDNPDNPEFNAALNKLKTFETEHSDLITKGRANEKKAKEQEQFKQLFPPSGASLDGMTQNLQEAIDIINKKASSKKKSPEAKDYVILGDRFMDLLNAPNNELVKRINTPVILQDTDKKIVKEEPSELRKRIAFEADIYSGNSLTVDDITDALLLKAWDYYETAQKISSSITIKAKMYYIEKRLAEGGTSIKKIKQKETQARIKRVESIDSRRQVASARSTKSAATGIEGLTTL